MKFKITLLLILLGIFLFSINSVNALVNNCCERTVDGAWCQNAPAEQCDSSFRSVPASCEATSYCKLGCCYDSQEGTCMENTPQKVCEDNNGIWEESASCEIPQCELGCCLIGDQAAFVTQIRCKRLSQLYGLEINYRTDIQNEIQCIASATSDVKGACVFEKEFETTCKVTSQKECNTMSSSEISDVKFHKGFLCTAPSLETNCAALDKTTCVDGKDGVYFIDSCGNIANIYDSSKTWDRDKNYWTYIAEYKEDMNICGSDSNTGSANSATCGNCDYYLGSTCKQYERGHDSRRPEVGDYICRDLGCEYEGRKYEHGETWCASAPGIEDNAPGSRYFRLVCYNSEVTVEPCADFRQEICLESEINGFKTAGCVVNKWQTCTSLTNQEDCEKQSKGDCEWIDSSTEGGIKCIPKYSPGLEFWPSDSGEKKGDAQETCSIGSVTCQMKFEKSLTSGWECVENCHCQGEAWKQQMKQVCLSLGDCASQENYLGYN
ncbi:hypothetical protein K9L16_01480 [Candidatus Pacearchaeota archaeon]|nr:hypothetical protein [Candidatus Pacearchaeota archaeon]